VIRSRLIAVFASAALAVLVSACSGTTVGDGGSGSGTGTAGAGTTTGGVGTTTGGHGSGTTTGGQNTGTTGGVECGGIHCNLITPVCDENMICRECVQDSDCAGSLSRKHCFRPDSGADDPFAKGYHCYQCVEDVDCQEVDGDGGHGANTNGPICDRVNFDTIFTCGPDCRADAGPDAGSPCLIPDDAGVVLTP
jgi:hypothetical protein